MKGRFRRSQSIEMAAVSVSSALPIISLLHIPANGRLNLYYVSQVVTGCMVGNPASCPGWRWLGFSTGLDELVKELLLYVLNTILQMFYCCNKDLQLALYHLQEAAALVSGRSLHPRDIFRQHERSVSCSNSPPSTPSSPGRSPSSESKSFSWIT